METSSVDQKILTLFPLLFLTSIFVFVLTSKYAPIQTVTKTSNISSLIEKEISYAAGSIVGDLNNDLTVNIFDLGILSANYGKTITTNSTDLERKSDLNNNLTVDVFDLGILIGNYGNTQQTTPTPSANLIWRPSPQTSFYWQLTGTINESKTASVYDIDVFESDASLVQRLHDKGKKVVCYMSAGSYENYRPDADDFPDEILGNTLDGWPDERWLDIRQWGLIKPIMGARLDICKQKGFDGVEFDNVDAFANDSGFPLTKANQITYLKNLANEAKNRGISPGLKNSPDLVSDLLNDYEWVLNEECFNYGECSNYSSFISAGKAVFNVEYDLQKSAFCTEATQLKFSSYRANLALDGKLWDPCNQ
ncbi:hypothetical protein HGA91_00120 [candidate division WWE3 bacterium]|nr:hypothetical protein [candidate division WWE3 bacterium]